MCFKGITLHYDFMFVSRILCYCFAIVLQFVCQNNSASELVPLKPYMPLVMIAHVQVNYGAQEPEEVNFGSKITWGTVGSTANVK